MGSGVRLPGFSYQLACYHLCDLQQINLPLWSSVSSFESEDKIETTSSVAVIQCIKKASDAAPKICEFLLWLVFPLTNPPLQAVDDSLAITDRISVRPDLTNETAILGILKTVSSQSMVHRPWRNLKTLSRDPQHQNYF